MKRFVTGLIVALTVLAAPAAASAAPTSGQMAAEVFYRDWNNRCGEGGPWCSDRRQKLKNEPGSYDSRGNVVTWFISYCWVDRTPFKWRQWCAYGEANTQYVLRLIAPSSGDRKNNGKILNSEG